ncbi:MAG: pyridoxamine 5'-phosphate oxidase family protein [Alteromonadaceae bacterium]|nr:pyridoxamine 5'-phosphate oxidase family protein [Alteromonadaceae bacterium]
MGQQFECLNKQHKEFIANQRIFFVGTAAGSGRVNISPKGMDSFRVLADNRIIWLNVTGSGNETAAHIEQCPRMTIMFCAFEGAPLILRLYGTAVAVHQQDEQWQELYDHFEPLPGARQVFDMQVDMVQSSCGMAVPFFDFSEDREQLKNWADKQGKDGIEKYWEKKNQNSIDGLPTHIVEKNLGK